MSDGNKARWLWPVGIVLTVITLVVVALAREPIQLDSSTPEGTVQEYLQAISDEDYNRAFEVLDPDGFEGCSTADLARSAPRDAFTATLGESGSNNHTEPIVGSGDHVIVEVTLRFGGGGLLGDTWDQHEIFFLTSEDGIWWITNDPGPWPYFTWACNRGDF